MSTNHSTTKESYQHLSEAERGKIETYLSEGLSVAEISRHLGRHRSTISREIKRGAVKQVKKQNGKKVYHNQYFAESAQNRYWQARKASYFLK